MIQLTSKSPAIAKDTLRCQYGTRRKTRADVSVAEAQRVAHNLLQSRCIQDAFVVFVYVSYNAELPTHDLITKLLSIGKVVCVPRIMPDETMHAVEIRSLDNLRPGKYGILEPMTTVQYAREIDVALVPGLAFSDRGDRLGYGGGNYDRFFAQYPEMLKVGICWRWQMCPEIPTEEHDFPMDEIIAL